MLNDPKIAKTLVNGLNVLQAFKAGDPALSNKELAERTGLSKATISRLTYTLLHKGLLIYEKDSRQYRLGPGTVSLGTPLLVSVPLRQIARPFMQNLSESTGGSVSLGMFNLHTMVYLETARGHKHHLFKPDLGARLPILSTAMGRAWLASNSTEQRNKILQELASRYPEEYTNFLTQWGDVLSTYQRDGFTYAQGDWIGDVCAVATNWPETINGKHLIFNCGIPSSLLSRNNIKDYGPKLLSMIQEVHAAMKAEAKK